MMYAVLATVALTMSVGCGGARIGALETELSTCKETRQTMIGENASLQEANAGLQAKADAMAKVAADQKALHDDLQAALLPLIDAGKASLSMRAGLITLAIPSDSLFDGGKADVKKDARETLVQVAGALKDVDQKFMIAAHTDSRAVKDKKARFRDNLEYTTASAYGVYAIISAAGVDRARLVVAGFGDADPVADNGTPEGQTQNRRIEIVVMPNMEAVLPAVAQAQ